MSSDPVLSAAGMTVLSPLQIMNVIEHRCEPAMGDWTAVVWWFCAM